MAVSAASAPGASDPVAVETLKARLAGDDTLAGFILREQAILTLYDRQTAEERATQTVSAQNRRGFSPWDSVLLSSFAEAIRTSPYCDGDRLTLRQDGVARNRLPKYAAQLLRAAAEAGPVEDDPVTLADRASRAATWRPDRLEAEIAAAAEYAAHQTPVAPAPLAGPLLVAAGIAPVPVVSAPPAPVALDADERRQLDEEIAASDEYATFVQTRAANERRQLDEEIAASDEYAAYRQAQEVEAARQRATAAQNTATAAYLAMLAARPGLPPEDTLAALLAGTEPPT